MSELPKGWTDSIFDDVLLYLQNGIGGKQNKDTIGLPVSRIETIADEKFDFNRIGFIEDFDESKISKHKLNKGDILFSHINSSIHLGKTAIFDTDKKLYHGINLLRLVVNSATAPNYFNYYCKHLRFLGYFSSIAQHAVNQASINQKKLKQSPFILAPLNEQIRIANKLDSLLGKLETTQKHFDKIPTLLKRFRQSVLAAAVSGELTAEWRKQNAGKKWTQKKLTNLVEKIEAGKNIKCIERPPEKHEYGIIKISAVTWGVYNENESKTLFDKDIFLENRRVQVGDFLISRANTIELLGTPVIVENVTKNLMLSDKVLRLVMDNSEKEWVNIFLRSSEGRKEIENRATGNQHSMRNIGQKSLLDIDLPYPSDIEKSEIVHQVESLFKLADKVEQQYQAAKQRTDKLTQSILAKAFRGELVPQDPNDEPASELLKRIKESRT